MNGLQFASPVLVTCVCPLPSAFITKTSARGGRIRFFASSARYSAISSGFSR